MDRTDKAILKALEGDARLSFADLGERVGLSKSPCWNRVQTLEASGAITGYHAALSAKALGIETFAFVQLSIAFDRHDAFETAVRAHPSIIACHATVGESDYLLQVATRSMADLDDFLRDELWRLPGVKRFTTTIAMRAVKTDGSLLAAADAP